MTNARIQKDLFDPLPIGSLEIKNRIAFAPTGMGAAGPEGSVSDQTICHYTARAKGGAGLIIVEHSICTRRHWKAAMPILSFHSSDSLPMMKDLADAIHHYGAKAVVQLGLGLGRQTTPKATGTQLVAPSPIPFSVPQGSAPKGLRHYEGQQGATPRELETDEIIEMEHEFVAAVSRIKRAGFDGIEIHGAHGYLLADFISPLCNHRSDRYGGSFKKRLTLPLNLIEKTRGKVGSKFVLGFRISGDEHVRGGLTLEDTLVLLPRLVDAGLDYIHLSSGRQEALSHLFPKEEGQMLPEAEAIKNAVDVPVICPNIHSPALARRIIEEGRVDVVSLSRSLLADPDWPLKTKEGKTDDIRRCIFCYTCLNALFGGLGTRCSVNPDVGRERFLAHCQPFE
ncbi:MAG: NADH:flavin oxidoreductase [Deltaproteobacteria bacterium]|nr:NADH:flavin oxidoreductase [Deltaproteobacteria bacterium]